MFICLVYAAHMIRMFLTKDDITNLTLNGSVAGRCVASADAT